MEIIALRMKSNCRQSVDVMYDIFRPLGHQCSQKFGTYFFEKNFPPLIKGVQVCPRQLWKQILLKKHINVTTFCARDFNKLLFRKHKTG